MKFVFFIVKKYLYSGSKNRVINIMSLIASIGLVVAATALFVVLSGFSGLKNYSLQFTTVVDPDLRILPLKGKSFEWSAELNQQISNTTDVNKVSTFVSDKVVIKVADKSLICQLKGVDSTFLDVCSVDKEVVLGNWFLPKSNEIVSGLGISVELSFGVINYLKQISLYVPKAGLGQFIHPKNAYNSESVFNVGITDINENLNNTLVYSDIDFARKLLGVSKNHISGIDVKLKPNVSISSAQKKLEKILGQNYLVKNRSQLNDALHRMLNTEYLAVYMIFTLILIIALFNIIGAIIMMILDKKEAIKTLFFLGTSLKKIRKIFFIQGTVMSLFGGIMGVIIGIILVETQLAFEWIMLAPNLPYPVEFKISNVILVCGTLFLLGVLSAALAASRIKGNWLQARN